MAEIIEHIDKIARDKKRDVLFIVFDPKKNKDKKDVVLNHNRNNPLRVELIKWLEANKIAYKECGPIASEYGWKAYMGEIYLDVPMDESDERYVKLNEHLEDEDGNMKIDGVMYMFLSLDIAMQNVHHDEPGFWDDWVEEF